MTTIIETANEVLRLDGLATPGEWLWSAVYNFGWDYKESQHGGIVYAPMNTPPISIPPSRQPITEIPYGVDDSAFIAFSRSAAPALAREVIRLAAEVEAMKTPVTWLQLDHEDGDTWQCSGCGTLSVWEDAPEECDVKYCSYCGNPVKFEPFEDDPTPEDAA